MSARRLFVSKLPPAGGELTLDDDSRRHVRVLRLLPGAALMLFDGEGQVAQATLYEAGRCHVDSPERAPRTSPELWLVLGMPKGKRLDACVRSATELGVAHVRLAVCERTQQLGDVKLERLTRVAREAARQSEQLYTPTIHGALPLGQAAAEVPKGALRLGCFARDTSGAVRPRTSAVAVAVGPEGGFTAAEVNELRALGYVSHPLGSGILRVETAVPVALALAFAGSV